MAKSLRYRSSHVDNNAMIMQTDLERARFLLTEALDEDEKGHVQDAIDLYTEAVELCIKIVSHDWAVRCLWLILFCVAQ